MRLCVGRRGCVDRDGDGSRANRPTILPSCAVSRAARHRLLGFAPRQAFPDEVSPAFSD
jgi:hypothetical protein